MGKNDIFSIGIILGFCLSNYAYRSFRMLVEKDKRGLGIGRSLIKKLIEWAKNNPRIEKVELSVFVNNHRATELYKKIGFVEEGRRKKEIKKAYGQYVDDILMSIFV